MSSSKKAKHLVIVESPKKARLLGRYLGDEYDVEASVGHVVDLPKKGLAVDVDNGYEPEFVTVRGKAKLIDQLKKKARAAEDILIATDPDREGEAIGYHIALKLGYEKDDGRRFRRVRFNEITPAAVREAVREPGELDINQVEAQQARRILDRLVGYGLSPLLWKKISPVDPISRTPLSAGRVQSVAVRLVVDRERERRRFRSGAWWDLAATFARDGQQFEAQLTRVDDVPVVKGSDFDPATGMPKKPDAVKVLGAREVELLKARLEGVQFRVESVESKPVTLRPYPPFTTSTLQQEANRKLNLSVRQTMQVAQRLYEAGHITYMRTDSVQLSGQALGAARRKVETLYGEDYLSAAPRTFKTKSKGAQEAHEAIRPAGTSMQRAAELRLRGVDASLYELIWKRTVATQMADARQLRVSASITGDGVEFRARGNTLEFAGFLRAYVEGSDDPEASLEDREVVLPPLESGDPLETVDVRPESHETRPPARYTDASLVKALEAEGIGRPSTYATIVETIRQRGYVDARDKQLVPTFIAFAVTALLENHFADLVDPGFTSEMEKGLDAIAEGDVDWRAFLEEFYRGAGGFEERLEERSSEIDPRTASTLADFADLGAELRIGRFGPFLETTGPEEPLRVSIPEDLAPADLTAARAAELLADRERADSPIGKDPDTGLAVYVRTGRFGPFVQLGEQAGDGEKPKRASLPKGMGTEAVSLDVALRLLSLPRDLGAHPTDGEPVRAGIGRYGPYVVHDGDFRSLEKTDDVYSIALDRALELLAQPKGGRRRSQPKPLRSLGAHPSDGQPVQLMEGRYGPYVKHGKLNASLPKDMSPEEIQLEQALELLAARAARGPATRGRRRGK
ncbi:MAG: type I DNA topoisomerase [Candidatus Palauibacterales bacterium]|nr:type I DNA topoisomerase [Candidatus Palauibacterales bacterium]MDP2482889.1 type I DNA topoisomerase [Candidatus Palauibacterales bacterium]